MGAADLIFSQFGIWSVSSTSHNVYLLVFYFAACVVQATFMVCAKAATRVCILSMLLHRAVIAMSRHSPFCIDLYNICHAGCYFHDSHARHEMEIVD